MLRGQLINIYIFKINTPYLVHINMLRLTTPIYEAADER